MNNYFKKENKKSINQQLAVIKNSILKSNFILGKEVEHFEYNFSKLCKVKYSVSCGNGTDALILALMALDLKKNDEVIIPAFSYYSTLSCILSLNLKPVFVDINIDRPTINIEDLKKKITAKTKAIIGVHLFGSVENFRTIKKIVQKKSIKLIEDASQSHGAYDENDKMTGSLGDIGCFSLYPTKNLGALGDSGILTTNSFKLFKKLKLFRNLGSVKKNLHVALGLNSRLDTIQASILNFKIKKLFKQNLLRRKISKIYLNNIQNKKIKIVKHTIGSVYHQFVILSKSRKKLINFLARNNVYTDIHYPYTLNKFNFLKLEYKNINFPNAEKFSKNCVSIPMHPSLPMKEAYRVCRILNKF